MDITDCYRPVTYKQDACKPRKVDKRYDCFVALEVIEHLEDSQEHAFKEAFRIADNVIISLPYKLNCPGDCHHGIDEAVIKKWVGMEPKISKII
jgi:hypothetical protein